VTDTVRRAIARTVGTLCGAIAVSFCLAHLNATPVVLAAFAVLFAWIAYGILNMNYALFSTAITAHIVFLLSLDQITNAAIGSGRLRFSVASCARLDPVPKRCKGEWERLERIAHSCTAELVDYRSCALFIEGGFGVLSDECVPLSFAQIANWSRARSRIPSCR
jgi:hypothetical protein